MGPRAPQAARAPSGEAVAMPARGYETVFTNPKAGMDGVDRERVRRIVYELSKDSPHFRNERRKEAAADERAAALAARAERLAPREVASMLRRVDAETPPSSPFRDLSRTWLHVDMDAFFASVERREDPSLDDVPFAVGGRDMVSTASYEARTFGVRSAMPGFIAERLCPQLRFVRPRFDAYKAASRRVKAALRRFDPRVEMRSLDEAALDVTDYMAAERIGVLEVVDRVRESVRRATGWRVGVRGTGGEVEWAEGVGWAVAGADGDAGREGAAVEARSAENVAETGTGGAGNAGAAEVGGVGNSGTAEAGGERKAAEAEARGTINAAEADARGDRGPTSLDASGATDGDEEPPEQDQAAPMRENGALAAHAPASGTCLHVSTAPSLGAREGANAAAAASPTAASAEPGDRLLHGSGQNAPSPASTHGTASTPLLATPASDASPRLFRTSDAKAPPLALHSSSALPPPLTASSSAARLREAQGVEVRFLTCSVGAAPNRLLAKIASDMNKPDGAYVIAPDEAAVEAFVAPLGVRKVPGIGKVSERTLAGLGIATCAQLWEKRGVLGCLLGVRHAASYARAGKGWGATRRDRPARGKGGAERARAARDRHPLVRRDSAPASPSPRAGGEGVGEWGHAALDDGPSSLAAPVPAADPASSGAWSAPASPSRSLSDSSSPPSSPSRTDRRGISRERTFRATSSHAELSRRLRELSLRLSEDMRNNGGLRGRTVTLKIKLASFELLTRSHTLPGGQTVSDGEEIDAVAQLLLAKEMPLKARLIGVRVGGFPVRERGQLALWELGGVESGCNERGRGPKAERGNGEDAEGSGAPGKEAAQVHDATAARAPGGEDSGGLTLERFGFRGGQPSRPAGFECRERGEGGRVPDGSAAAEDPAHVAPADVGLGVAGAEGATPTASASDAASEEPLKRLLEDHSAPVDSQPSQRGSQAVDLSLSLRSWGDATTPEARERRLSGESAASSVEERGSSRSIGRPVSSDALASGHGGSSPDALASGHGGGSPDALASGHGGSSPDALASGRSAAGALRALGPSPPRRERTAQREASSSAHAPSVSAETSFGARAPPRLEESYVDVADEAPRACVSPSVVKAPAVPKPRPAETLRRCSSQPTDPPSAARTGAASQRGGSADAGREPHWACSACTLHNALWRSVCAVCAAPRPVEVLAAAARARGSHGRNKRRSSVSSSQGIVTTGVTLDVLLTRRASKAARGVDGRPRRRAVELDEMLGGGRADEAAVGLREQEHADEAAVGLREQEHADEAAVGLREQERADEAADGLREQEHADEAADGLREQEHADEAADGLREDGRAVKRVGDAGDGRAEDEAVDKAPGPVAEEREVGAFAGADERRIPQTSQGMAPQQSPSANQPSAPPMLGWTPPSFPVAAKMPHPASALHPVQAFPPPSPRATSETPPGSDDEEFVECARCGAWMPHSELNAHQVRVHGTADEQAT